MTFEINKITGFRAFGSPVVIFKEGREFYYLEPEDRECTFNLPAGRYWTENILDKLEKPLEYICPPVPKPEKRILKNLPSYEIRTGDNPNKASVRIGTGDIFLDSEFVQKPEPFLTFVLFHELSHNKYFTEWKCDVNAANEMLKRGFNPSQCFYGNYYCLSNRQAERKDILFDWLKKVRSI